MTLRFREELNRVCASKEEWGKLQKELLVATNRQFGWLQKRRDRRGRRGSSPEELVQEAIARGLSGRRRWPEERVDLFGFLWGTVCSIASYEARCLVGAPEWVSLDGEGEQENRKASDDPDPGEIIEGHDLYKRFYKTLDEKLAAVLEGKLDGLKQCEIAQQLGVSNAAVTRLVTELAERWLKFCEE